MTDEKSESRRRMEAELERERRYNRNLIDTAQAIILVLSPEGRIVGFNPYMEQLSGYRLEEVRGKDWFTVFLKEETRDKTRELFRSAVSGIQTRGNIDYVVTKDGCELQIEWYDSTLKNEKGGVEGLLCIGQDVTKRKQAEFEINMLSRLPAENPNPVMRVRSGVVHYANPASKSVLAHLGSAPGRKLPRDWDLRIAGALRDGKTQTFEQDFGDRTYSFTIAPLVNLGYANIYGADITAHKKAKRLIVEQSAMITAIIESAGFPIFAVDRQYRYTHFNVAHANVMKALYGAEIRRGHSLDEYQTVPEDWQRARKNLDRALRGESFIESAYSGAEGFARKYFEIGHNPVRTGRGEIIGASVFVRDITERMKAETDSRETYEMQGMLNAMLHRSLANIPLRDKLDSHLAALLSAPWLSIESKGAVFLTASSGAALVLTAHQGLSQELLSICGNVPFGRCLCGKAAALGRAFASKSVDPEHQITCEGMKPHGHYCAPITAEGKVLGVLNLYLKEGGALTQDQERFVKAVADVMAGNIIHSQVEEKFSQSQKMEAIGLLAGGVAHDFNNILTAIKCYAEFIRKELSPQDPKLADTQEILNSVERAIALTRQLLAFSRRQIMAPKVMDINGILGNMANMLRRIIGEDITLETRLFPGPCLVMVDPGQLEQVILNLAVNARDAMPGGGALILETHIMRPPDEFFFARPDLPIGQLVCLKVRDTGTGMRDEVKNRLFEPFFTTKAQGKGTGLGLPMVFGIIKQSRGEVEVESAPGKGSSFVIYLPFVETLPVVKGKNKSYDRDGAKETPVKGQETILLVEDEETLRRLGERILRDGGYKVLVAADGRAALNLVEERGKPVDLLMTDVVMPGMSGRELAKELTRRKMIARTLYMSGYTDEAIVKHGILEPGIAFIYKPFTIEAVMLKLREVLDNPADQAKA